MIRATLLLLMLLGVLSSEAQTPSDDLAKAVPLFRDAFEHLRSREYVAARQGFEAGLKFYDRDVNAWLYYHDTVSQLAHLRFDALSKHDKATGKIGIPSFVDDPEWQELQRLLTAGERRIRELKPTDEQFTKVLVDFYRLYPNGYVGPYVPFRLTDVVGKKVCSYGAPSLYLDFLGQKGAKIVKHEDVNPYLFDNSAFRRGLCEVAIGHG